MRGLHAAVLVCALIPSGALAAEAPETARIRISLAPHGLTEIPMGILLLRSASSREPREVPIASSAVTVEVLPGSAWEVSTRISSVWTPSEAVLAGPAGSETAISLPAWPVARLQGALRAAPDEPRLPAELRASIEAAPLLPEPRRIRRGSFLCPIDEHGRWHCELPAGAVIDIALRVDGYVPHYLWGLALEAGTARTLESIALVKGASLSGWLRAEEGTLDPAKTRVRLFPQLAPRSSPEIALRLRRSAQETPLRRDGFFQFAAAHPGKYVLSVEHPGYAQAQLSPVEIQPGAESALREAITLQRPLTLEILLDPPLDGAGRPWRVEVRRGADLIGSLAREPAHSGAAPADGRLRIPDQSPGRFELLVTDSAGNRLFGEMRRIEDAASARIAIQLATLPIEGTLRLGEEPLAGRVFFGGKAGGVRIPMTANAEGIFQGQLPRDGAWIVDVSTPEPSIEIQTDLTVKRGRPVEIDLPDTHLMGSVVDEQDRPVPGARVTVTEFRGAHSLPTTDQDGRFEVRALKEGWVYLSATAGSKADLLTSSQHTASLQGGTTTGPITLRLQRRREISGRVVSTLGPVAGARVNLLGSIEDPEGDQRATTDLEGRFSFQAAANAQGGTLVIAAPGYALKVLPVSFQGQPLEVAVSDQVGNLELHVLTEEDSPEQQARLIVDALLLQDGQHLPLSLIVFWVHAHGLSLPPNRLDGLRVPALAPGEYRFCSGPLQELLTMTHQLWAETRARCEVGLLTPGGELTLTLDLRKPGEQP